jgi:translocation and assembly module TamB
MPAVNGQLRFHDICANGEHIGDINIDAVTSGRDMQVTMRSHLEAASLSVDGNIRLSKDLPGTLIAHFENFDFDPLLRAYFEDRITGHSSANGRVEITGTFRHPESLKVHGLIPELSAQIEKITLTNSEPIEFTYTDRVADLRSFHLRGENTDLRATGRINVANRTLDMHVKGDVNLRLAEGFYPGLLSYGTLGVEMGLSGTWERPMQVGQVTVRDAGVSFTDLPNGLSNINGTLVFNENRLQVQTLAANTGGGALNIGGFISYQNGIYFDLTARGKDVRLRYPPGLSAAADADLRYSGTPKASLLSGDILVTRFGVNPRFDFALYLATTKNAPTGPSANSLLDNMRIDVHVTSTPELRVETELAKIAGDADLRFRGTLARPTVLGRVNIAEGDIFFNSTKYRLERGDISFNNPVRIEPVLNVEASARVREYDITLGFHGSVDKLSTTYRSEPPLPTADIIALLALGRTREDAVLNNQPIQQNFAETASSAILGQALDAAVSSRVQKLFGVSRIKIDPQVGGPETATGARVTIEQQVNNNVTLTYITNLARANQQIIQGEFNFSRDLSLVVVRDENGVLGFDIKIRHRKK